MEYLVSFIRAKLNKLDDINKEWNAVQLDAGKQTGSSSADVPDGLGAPDAKEKSLLELMNNLKFPVPNLPNLLEAFVNSFRTPIEGYYKVRKEHMVIKSYHLWL